MKYLTLLFALAIACSTSFAQEESKWPDLDASTLDAVYYPAESAWRNYLSDDKRNLSPQIKLVYSRPMMKDRKIFGELIKYGEEWRLGANEATLITFYQPVDIGGTTINSGAYSVFALVNEKEWTFNFSSETNIWGNANRDESKTVASITVPVININDSREALTMTFQEMDERNANLVVEWDKSRAIVPIGFNPILMDELDPSPMDMAHYPRKSAFTNYLEGEDKNIKPKIQVTYSRPQKKGRTIFGDLLKEGSIWRIGANEATEVVFFQDVKVGNTEVKRGRYAMFAKLNGSTWDIILSKDYPIWGAANRDESKDAYSVTIPVTKDSEVVEALSIIFEEKSDNSTNMIIAWDQTRATIPVSWK